MTIYGIDASPAKVRMPLAGQTVNGTPFTVPKGAMALSIFCPDLVGISTYRLQSLLNSGDDQQTEVWLDINAFTPTGVVALAAIPENSMTTFPVSVLGGGVLRMVASADQSGTPVDVPMEWHMGTL